MINTHLREARSHWVIVPFFLRLFCQVHSFKQLFKILFYVAFSCFVQWEFLALYNYHISRIEAIRIDYLIHY